MKTFTGVLAGLVLLAIVLIIVASQIGGYDESQETAQSKLENQRAEQRLQPVGSVRLAGEPAPTASQASQPAKSEPMSGKQVVQQVCLGCHGSGVMGAPKFGSKDQWEPRLSAQGFDTLVHNAINGFKAMPPKGGNASLTDDEMKKAVTYMLKNAGLSPK